LPGARAEATVRLRLARVVARGTTVTVNGRLEAVGLLPLALSPVTIPTVVPPVVAGSFAGSMDFEGSVGAWKPWYSAEVSSSTMAAWSGAASGRIDLKARYGWALELSNWPGFAATPGPKAVGFWGRLGGGSGLGVTMTVKWRNDAGVDLRVARVSIPVLGFAWQEATAQLVAPEGTTRVGVELSSSSGGLGDYLFVDGLHVQ